MAPLEAPLRTVSLCEQRLYLGERHEGEVAPVHLHKPIAHSHVGDRTRQRELGRDTRGDDTKRVRVQLQQSWPSGWRGGRRTVDGQVLSNTALTPRTANHATPFNPACTRYPWPILPHAAAPGCQRALMGAAQRHRSRAAAGSRSGDLAVWRRWHAPQQPHEPLQTPRLTLQALALRTWPWTPP